VTCVHIYYSMIRSSHHQCLLRIGGDDSCTTSLTNTYIDANNGTEEETEEDSEDVRHSKSVSVATYIMKNAGVAEDMIDTVIHRFFQRCPTESSTCSMICPSNASGSMDMLVDTNTTNLNPISTTASQLHFDSFSTTQSPTSGVASRRTSRRRLNSTLDDKIVRESLEITATNIHPQSTNNNPPAHVVTIGDLIPGRPSYPGNTLNMMPSGRKSRKQTKCYIPICFCDCWNSRAKI